MNRFVEDNRPGRDRVSQSGRGIFILSFVLLLIPLLSILFYGVVGPDKALNLTPATLFGYLIVTAAMGWRIFRRSGPEQRLPVASLPFLIFLAYAVFAIFPSAIPVESKDRVLGIGLFFGAYFVWGTSLQSYRRNRIIFGVLIGFALLSGIYGLFLHFKNPDAVLWVTRYTDHYDGRLASLYICPNHYAHFLQMLMPFCLVILFIPQSGLFLRLMSGYALILFFPVLFFTESRAGFLGALGALMVTALLMALRKAKALFISLLVVIPLAVALLFFVAWNQSEVFKRRMEPVFSYMASEKDDGLVGSSSPDFRPQTWQDTLEMIQDKPLIGYGPATYRYLFPEHRIRFGQNKIVTGHPHNEYLELTAEYGLIGFGLFALAWMYGLFRIFLFSLKSPNKHHALIAIAFLGAAAGTMFHSFFDFEMHIFPNAFIFALLAGITVAQMQSQSSSKKRKEEGKLLPIKQGMGRAVIISLAIASVLATIFSAQIAISESSRWVGSRAAEKGNDIHAENLFLMAQRVDRNNWRAAGGLAQLYYNRRYFALDLPDKNQLAQKEKQHFERTLEINPKYQEAVYGLGQVEIFLGNTERGIDLLREATKLRPFNSGYWWHLGVALRDAERYDEALEVFEYAYKLQRTKTSKRNIAWIKGQIDPSSTRPKVPAKKPAKKKTEAILELEKLFEGFAE